MSNFYEAHVGWPVHDPRKEWPIKCFEGQDVSADTLRRDPSGRGRPLIGRASIASNQTMGGVAAYGR